MQPLSQPDLARKVQDIQDQINALSIRIGIVKSYTAGAIIVQISGSQVLVNATYLSSYFPNIGDNVAVLKYDTQWIVLGGFGQTQSRLVPVSASVSTIESTSSVTYTDLATIGPAVSCIVGASGSALVQVTAEMHVAGAVPGGLGAFASYLITQSDGTNVVTSPADNDSVWVESTDTANNTVVRATATSFRTGILPGLTTFTMKYRSLGSTVTFAARNIVVTPY